MRIPILSDQASRVIYAVALGLVVALPMVLVPAAADPYQPGRAVALGLVGLSAVVAGPVRLPRSLLTTIALSALASAAVLIVISAIVAQPASAVFGVHGRFQGLVSGAAAVVAFAVGAASAPRARVLPRAAALVLAVQCAVVVWQLAIGESPTGTMGNQVLVGAWMAVGIALVAAGARAERGWIATALWSVAALGVLVLGVVGSRGAWVGLLAAGAVIAGSARAKVRRTVVIGLVVTVAAGAALGGAASLGKLDPAARAGGSAAARLAIWSGTAELIADHAIVGIGPGRFLYAFAPYQPAEHARMERGVRPDQAHSVVLQTAAESGVPAALAALAFIGVALFAAVRRLRSADGIALIACAGLAAWAGQALFGISTIESDALAFMLAGVALSRTGSGDRTADTPGWPSAGRVGVLALSLALALTSAYFLSVDARHERGVRAFFAGEMASAWELETSASARNPLVDTYRVGAADAALYGGGPRSSALALVERGLELEPASYDLALARARLLASMGSGSGAVMEAYLRAVERYPRGIEILHETIEVAMRLGHDDVARDVAARLLQTYPDDVLARAVAGKVGDGP